jgi:transporter family-2 protein
MIYYIFLGLINGMTIALSRILNARLSDSTGPMYASFMNHILGFVLLLLFIFFSGHEYQFALRSIPPYLFWGGILGAVFVAINSYLIPQIGALKVTLSVIAGQLVFSIWSDFILGTNHESIIFHILGGGLIFLGLWIGRYRKTNR